MPENTLPYKINDADNHFNEPLDCFERYIDPSKSELAIRYVTAPDGKRMQLFAGQPSKFHSKQVTFSSGYAIRGSEVQQIVPATFFASAPYLAFEPKKGKSPSSTRPSPIHTGMSSAPTFTAGT